MIAGWNASNRLVIGRDVKPGQTDPACGFRRQRPAIQSADEFHMDAPGAPRLLSRRARSGRDHAERGQRRSDSARIPRSTQIVGPNPKIFKLAEGFQFTEGPVWVRDGGYLLFSDPNANTQYKYTKDGETIGLPHSQRLLGRRHRRVRPARVQRSDARPRRAAHDQRAWQPSRDATGEGRNSDGAWRTATKASA